MSAHRDLPVLPHAFPTRRSSELVRRSGRELQFETVQPVTLMLRRLSFKRALSNLIENALRFGRRVRLTMERRRDSVELHIDDDGPGIPEKERHKVFRPFYRQTGRAAGRERVCQYV